MTETRIAVATLATAGLAATGLAAVSLVDPQLFSPRLLDPQWRTEIDRIVALLDQAWAGLGLVAVFWLAWRRPAVSARTRPGPVRLVATAPQPDQPARPGMMEA